MLITKTVKKLINQNPLLQEGLSLGIINNLALAHYLKPRVEGLLGQEVNVSAINMALRRINEVLTKEVSSKLSFCNDSDITMKNSLSQITLFKGTNINKRLVKLYDIIDINKGDVLTITQGMNEISILTNSKYTNRLKKIFNNGLKNINNDLALLSIRLPPKAVNIKGLFYLATRALYLDHINIVDIISTFTEMSFILKEKDIIRAYQSIYELIKRQSLLFSEKAEAEWKKEEIKK